MTNIRFHPPRRLPEIDEHARTRTRGGRGRDREGYAWANGGVYIRNLTIAVRYGTEVRLCERFESILHRLG